ncbi:hypothetical protein GCM10011375_35990 [Hymenobacter qilianensis]|uniref:Uncharacterized protein n=2 Tax=Hymenobacter qilianensis TaxID=1385715 RepID=A0ACB5PW51_9BACT|nr:hypothetical protein [Hymenobacter qilianensis]QNP51172.1 hypothetical protein H9L05_13830 [Hymenobacter qilianensis]GGF77733.1 hypothetical protein GCM10011375_35990 [Hymenobacter qilianensis]
MKKIFPLAFILFMAAFSSCKTDRANKVAIVDPVSPAAAKAQLDVFRDTLDVRWTRMIASDDAKMSATTQVLSELRKQPDTNATQIQQLARANERLKTLRYSQQSMAASERIDAYDAAQDSVLRAIYEVALPASGPANETVQTLTESIQSADSEVVGHRVRYDQAAKQFNNYLKLHESEISKIGGEYSQLQPLPLFELQQ